MTMLQYILALLIRNGKVTVETPDLDMEELRKAVDGRAVRTLELIEGIVFEEALTDREKVESIQKELEEENGLRSI